MMDGVRHIASDPQFLDRGEIASLQRQKLAALLTEILPTNAFYGRKLAGIAFDALRDPIESLPFTTRAEIEEDQADHPPYGSNLTYPLDRYVRMHQTSGSMGRPVRWLDTGDSWEWIKRCWRMIYEAAGVTPRDRLMLPFSFGPFLGFWGAFDAAMSMGIFCIASGGMTTTARLRAILDNQITIVGCTPTYALRMVEVAREEGIDLARSAVRSIIVAGEPGGNIPATRERIETGWNARVFDHTGMTEIGSLGFECHQRPGGVHLIETECIAEVIDPHTLRPVPDGHCGELVITSLGRLGSPVIRYRTGDEVCITRDRCACGRCFARMNGGILGRIDDMFIVRGTNVFPSALEAIIRRFSEISEFRVTITEGSSLAQVRIEVEPWSAQADPTLADRVARAVHVALSFRTEVNIVPPGTLPRFDMKARRFLRQRQPAAAPAPVATKP